MILTPVGFSDSVAKLLYNLDPLIRRYAVTFVGYTTVAPVAEFLYGLYTSYSAAKKACKRAGLLLSPTCYLIELGKAYLINHGQRGL